MFIQSYTLRDILKSNCAFQPTEMQYGLPCIIDEVSLADCIRIRLHKLLFAIVEPGRHYRVFHLEKKKKKYLKVGDNYVPYPETRRVIKAPTVLMKAIHRGLAAEIFDKIPLPSYITGFRKGVSCVNTAEAHADAETIIALDIRDFFTSVRAKTIRHFLGTWGYSWVMANAISQLLTTDNELIVPKKREETSGLSLDDPAGFFKTLPVRSLAQGSPASPVVSNVITALTFGPEVAEYCKVHDLRLTIYVDDVTVSTKPGAEELDLEHSKRIVADLTRIIKSHGFSIRYDKVDIMNRRTYRQTVMGITLNDGMHVPQKYNTFKAVLHNVVVNGWYTEARRWLCKKLEAIHLESRSEEYLKKKVEELGISICDPEELRNLPLTRDNLKHINLGAFKSWLTGNINWINQVDPRKGGVLCENLRVACEVLKADNNENRAAHGPSYLGVTQQVVAVQDL